MSKATRLVDHRRIFISDCEGPISKNDNAFELAKQFIPDGERLFTLISRYDDVLADIVKREGYKAGDTLKLILPFLKAYGVTDKSMREYSLRNILLVPGAKEMLRFVKGFMPAFIVSTSYEHYMKALCNSVDFPFENVYCTELNLDGFKMSEGQSAELKRMGKEMVRLKIPEIPKRARSLNEFPVKKQNTVMQLDEIFWKQIASMEIGAVLKVVAPLGGPEKASAVSEIVSRMKADLEDVMYVGDSITDVSAFRLVRRGNGLTVSFNGNSFAVREAEVAVLSENAVVTATLADVFNKFGKRRLKNLIKDWKSLSSIEKLKLSRPLKKSFLRLYRKRPPKAELVTARNRETLMQESTAFRKTLRGEDIGRLG